VLFSLANAAFSIGKVQEADEAMAQALKAGIPQPRLEAAMRFESIIALVKNPDQAALEREQIESALKLDPGYGPAIMALGEVEENRHNAAAAAKDYEKLLQEYPDFSPAKRRLAVLYSNDPDKDARTSELAISAREAYPADPDLARVLGIVSYRDKNFAMASGLLQESAQLRGGDAEVMFYLGMSKFELKDLPASRKALQQALDIGLATDHSDEARKTLALIK
jgi:tetratricopeptide (TPR) repeat protein